MGNMTISNLPDEIHDAPKHRAQHDRRSVEADVRALSTGSIVSGTGGGLGDRLRDRFSEVTGEELSGLRASVPARTDTGA